MNMKRIAVIIKAEAMTEKKKKSKTTTTTTTKQWIKVMNKEKIIWERDKERERERYIESEGGSYDGKERRKMKKKQQWIKIMNKEKIIWEREKERERER